MLLARAPPFLLLRVVAGWLGSGGLLALLESAPVAGCCGYAMNVSSALLPRRRGLLDGIKHPLLVALPAAFCRCPQMRPSESKPLCCGWDW